MQKKNTTIRTENENMQNNNKDTKHRKKKNKKVSTRFLMSCQAEELEKNILKQSTKTPNKN